jgi:hypothetical protein
MKTIGILASMFRRNDQSTSFVTTDAHNGSSSSDPRMEKFKLDADSALCRGNIRLNLGLSVSEAEVASRRDRVLKMKF